MFTPTDEKILHKRGISRQQAEAQMRRFADGFPFLTITKPATVGDGIIRMMPADVDKYVALWEDYLASDAKVLKFVPASGAASRMFKDLFAFAHGDTGTPESDFDKQFFDSINRFAFYDDLNAACLQNEGLDIAALLAQGKFRAVAHLLLDKQGLNYGQMPKGLLKFHAYPDEKRTPFQEHLAEGVCYARSAGEVHIHFTVSGEHRALFEEHLSQSLPLYEVRYGVKFKVTFSEQKPSTDTIAADADNRPFRENGELLFRPGGHGALIANLNDLESDIVFIKNIDNVTLDARKTTGITYKQVLGGLMVELQQQAFACLRELECPSINENRLAEIARFCEERLHNRPPWAAPLQGETLRKYLYDKLNRPIRVCGMVKNEGEPGGGPYLVESSADGVVSPQILESSQISPANRNLMAAATHFNPVDLVCGIRNYKGEKFDLLRYVDSDTGFVSSKSKNGRELKALELPGLWNGGMSDWNTVFVETPVETFSPVKTVNDLLRQEHCA